MGFEWGSLGIGVNVEKIVGFGSHVPLLVLYYMLRLLIVGGHDDSEPGLLFLKQLSVVHLSIFAVYMIYCTRCAQLVTAIRDQCGQHSKTATFLMSQGGLWLAYVLFESITISFSCVRYDKCSDLFPSMFLHGLKQFMKNVTDKSLVVEFLLLIPALCLTGASIVMYYLLDLRRRNLTPRAPAPPENELVIENGTENSDTSDLSSVEDINDIVENVISSVEEININDEKERFVKAHQEDGAPAADGIFSSCCNSEQTACVEGGDMNSTNGNLPANDQLIPADNEDASGAANVENEVISTPLNLQPPKAPTDNRADLLTDSTKVECKAKNMRRKGKNTSDSINDAPQRKSARLQEKQRSTKK